MEKEVLLSQAGLKERLHALDAQALKALENIVCTSDDVGDLYFHVVQEVHNEKKTGKTSVYVWSVLQKRLDNFYGEERISANPQSERSLPSERKGFQQESENIQAIINEWFGDEELPGELTKVINFIDTVNGLHPATG